MFMGADVVRDAFELEARMVATPVTWWEMLAHQGGDFMFLHVFRVMYHPIDARRWHLISWLIDSDRWPFWNCPGLVDTGFKLVAQL